VGSDSQLCCWKTGKHWSIMLQGCHCKIHWFCPSRCLNIYHAQKLIGSNLGDKMPWDVRVSDRPFHPFLINSLDRFVVIFLSTDWFLTEFHHSVNGVLFGEQLVCCGDVVNNGFFWPKTVFGCLKPVSNLFSALLVFIEIKISSPVKSCNIYMVSLVAIFDRFMKTFVNTWH